MMGEDANPFVSEADSLNNADDPEPPTAAPAGRPVSNSFQDLDISSGTPAAGGAAGQPAQQFSATAPPAGQANGAGASPDLAVTVANPCKQGEGMSAYFTYEVTTRTSLPQYAFGQFSVTRRFRDFDWLHAQLSAKFPGAIVPPLPEKHSAQTTTLKAVGKAQSDDFLENRRHALQRFLHSLAAHPMLHTAADLQAFLEKPDDALDAWKDLSKQSKPPAYAAAAQEAKAGLLSGYAKAASLFGGEPASSSFTPVADVPCQQMGNYATALQAQVTSVHKHSKAYIDKNKAIATSLTGFGAALGQLSECEAAINESLSRGISHMGETVERISTTYAEQAEREGAAFEDPMKHYARVLGSVKTAIHARENALHHYNRASAALAAKKEKLERLRASSGKEEKIQLAAREVTEAEEAANLGKSDYESVAARVDAEMGRFQTEKLADFKKYCVGFIKLQLEYSARVQTAWRELLPRLEEIEGGTVAYPGATAKPEIS